MPIPYGSLTNFHLGYEQKTNEGSKKFKQLQAEEHLRKRKLLTQQIMDTEAEHIASLQSAINVCGKMSI